jgi:hypothetical protein
MNYKTLLLFLIIVFSSSSIVFAQIDYEKRIEFSLNEKYDSYSTYEFGELGLILYSRESNSNTRKLEKLDTNLEIVQTQFIEIPDKQKLSEVYSNDSLLYLFYKARKGDYTLVEVNIKTMLVIKLTGSFPKKTWVNSVNVIGNTAFFEIILNKNSAITTFDLATGTQSIIPIFIKGYKDKHTFIEGVQTIEDTKEYFVFVNAFKKKNLDLHVFKFDENGQQIRTINLSENIDQKLSSVSVSYVGDSQYIFSGTYSSKKSYSSEGLYFCKITNDNVEFTKFYNFLEFEEFLSYLPQRKINKIERKKNRKDKKGKAYSISYLVESHEILKYDNKYFFLGEAYYPTYRTEYYTDYSTGQTRTRRVFDGYQYTHATLVAFDEQGNKLWDKTFEMWPSYKPFYTAKFVTMSIFDENINLLFINRKNLVSMSFSTFGEIQNEKSYDFMETANENDKLRYSYANLTYWYENYFVAFGNQKIKNNTDETDKRKRKVFFVNKISYK